MPAPGACRAATRIAHRLIGLTLLAATLLVAGDAFSRARTDIYTDAGIVGLTVTNLGYVGDGFESPYQPSAEYPIDSKVEHLFLGGLWVGAVAADGTIHVSTGAQDSQNLTEGDEIREFDFYFNTADENDPENFAYVWSNRQNDPDYNADALASQHIQVYMTDYANVESGSHTPLGLKIIPQVD